ncbi:cupin [Paenibacillus puldeungensis]|uniref:Cupin n=1 Tax=Paenibacillus puldeungensis TaxID=696536 RepID=A0ABW3S101_9BACL
MKIYSYGKEHGKPVDRFDSQNVVMTPIIRMLEKQIDVIQIGCIHLSEQGIIGGHEAAVPQLFLVVSGEGLVTGKENVIKNIKAGELAVWEAGEWHEIRTELGMTAIVVESDHMDLMNSYLVER